MRLLTMLRKEVLQFSRNPVLLRMALLLPLVQTLVLSYAANLDVNLVPLSVWDEDDSTRSRALLDRIAASTYFDAVARHHDGASLERDLDTGHAALALHVPPGFGADLQRGQATIQVLVDGTESTTASVAAGYLAGIATAFDQAVRADQRDRQGRRLRLPQVSPEPRVFYNPDLRSLWYMAPAVMAMVLTVLMQNLTALSIARERELGTLEQLVMTPLRPAELLMGKLLPYAVVGLVDALIVSLVVVYGFGVPLRGSVVALSLATLLFLVATLGLGLVVSTISANQQQAQLTNFFLSFPAILLSGFIFPLENMPLALQAVSRVVPMTPYLIVIRGVYLRGADLGVLTPQMVHLALLALLFFGLGAARFHKRLE